MLLGVEGGRWWMRGLPAQSLAFISYSSLASFGDYPLMASVAPLAVDLRPRLFVSDSVFELSGFSIITSSTTCLSFIVLFFSTFYSLVTQHRHHGYFFFAIRQ